MVRVVAALALLVNLYFTLAPSPNRPGLLADLRFIIANPRLLYHDKMDLKYPELYRRIRFIAEHTDARANVLVPGYVQNGLPATYLLFPRIVDTHRAGFLWGQVPPGTLALVDGRWPDAFGNEVRRSSRLVTATSNFAIIERIQ